jgi:pyrrolidone-carboxylate peptidase
LVQLLVTGFGPFLQTDVNPSAVLAEGCGHPFRILPVGYQAVAEFLESVAPSSFDVMLMLGVATKRAVLCPELVGRNRRGATPGVDGVALPGEIELGGPELVESSLWIGDVLSAVSALPGVEVSRDAGDYLCNDIAYRAVRRFPDKRVGFLHVPPFGRVPRQVQSGLLGQVLEIVRSLSLPTRCTCRSFPSKG